MFTYIYTNILAYTVFVLRCFTAHFAIKNTYTYIYIHIDMYTAVYIHIILYICIYMQYTFIYIYIHTYTDMGWEVTH